MHGLIQDALYDMVVGFLLSFCPGFQLVMIIDAVCGGLAALHQFTQQNLPACKPVLTPAAVSSFTILEYFMVPL